MRPIVKIKRAWRSLFTQPPKYLPHEAIPGYGDHHCSRYGENSLRFPTGRGVMKYIMCLKCGKTHEEYATSEGVFMTSIPFSEWKIAKDQWDADEPNRTLRYQKAKEEQKRDEEAAAKWLREYNSELGENSE